jgi:signal transduction histidine kinase
LPIVVVDAGGIQQVLLNLLRNAQQALAQQEQKTLSVCSLYDREASRVRVEVADNGAGIPESIQKRIFDPFFTTKPTGIGTGLGLAVSKRIMEQHRGTLSFESRPGRGTTFRIDLPVKTRDLVVATN